VRSALKPSLSEEYYWNVIYDTLPSRERARMRHFWEKGSATKGKDPEAFFTQL
jgi:predicted solute-binding protein